eukprot:SAG31_NODE_6503_length_1993_cov_5.581837_2_plen_68_part_00
MGAGHIVVPAGAEPGFDMFMDKCADGTETLEELSRRWNALSDARKVRSYFLVFVPTIREIRDFYREM